MARLPAYGRELLLARRSGLAPLPHPYGPPGRAGLVMVTDSWAIASAMRRVGRTALVIEPGETYNWAMVKGLAVWISTRHPAQETIEAIRKAGAAEVGDYFGRDGHLSFERECKRLLSRQGETTE